MPRWARVRWMVVGLGLVLAWGLRAPGADGSSPTQSPPAKLLYHKARSFRIPITVAPDDRKRLRQVLLYSSVDSGLNSALKGRTAPDQPFFTFNAPRDSEYWFAVRPLDTQGRPY